jgi:hypothetical protein
MIGYKILKNFAYPIDICTLWVHTGLNKGGRKTLAELSLDERPLSRNSRKLKNLKEYRYENENLSQMRRIWTY